MGCYSYKREYLGIGGHSDHATGHLRTCQQMVERITFTHREYATLLIYLAFVMDDYFPFYQLYLSNLQWFVRARAIHVHKHI